MLSIENLLIDGRKEPLDASLRPSFSWRYSDNSNSIPASYHLLVKESGITLWDSGEKEAKRNFGILYRGKKLQYRKEYQVILVVKTKDNECVSFSTHFETRIGKDQWLGTWIGVPDAWNGGALSIRKELDSFQGKNVKKARCYVAGIGYHEFYVNGHKIGDALLEPGVTDYDQKVLYRTYDITKELCLDKNVLGFLLGYGWYGNRKLRMQLYVDFTDGSTYEAHSYSNYNWWFAPSPIIRNSIYSGESYDARIEDEYPGGFSSPDLTGGYNHHWFGGIHSQQNMGELVPEEMNPIRALGEYPGERIHTFNPNHFVYDIKQNIAGFCRIQVRGKRGSSIRLRHAETLKDDGHIDQTNLRTADAEDIYILKGEGVETYSPRFTYHGFRYVEVWIEGEAELLSLTGLHVHSDNRPVGYFSTDDPILNRLHKMAVITEQNNETSILTDCPQRDERFGWLNDVSTRVFQCLYNFDMNLFLEKVDTDMTLTQDKNGAITDTAPYYTGGRPADVTSISYLLLAREAYRFYGSRKICQDNYAGHKAWVEFLLTHQKDFIMDYYYYADWVPCTSFPDAVSDGIAVSSYFLYWHLSVLSELAGILGKKTDQQRYRHLAAQSKKSLNEHYFHDDHYVNGTMTEDGMALYLGLAPNARAQKAVYEHLRRSVIDHHYHLTCGNQGYRLVMAELCEHGDADLVLKVLKNPEYPGWGFMLQNGATTVWERWEKENLSVMNSFDHPMFGSYDYIFYRYLAGIHVKDIATNDIEIAPVIASSLHHVEGRLDTVRGELRVSWDHEGNKIRYTIHVPVAMKVQLHLPGHELQDDGVTIANDALLASGDYCIVGTLH